jgi:aryl-alcohol dehydrogenase-like predicted oxidoreductase
MQRRPLGKSGLTIPPLALGANVFGWTLDTASSFALLDAALEAGLDFIDTADSYSRWVEGNAGGESETILGDWMAARGNRGRVILATKVGSEMGPGKKGLRGDYVLAACDASLRRLKTDYIDLYQSHWDDPETPFEETLAAYETLIKAGKVRVIGASNLTAERLGEALATAARTGLPRYESLQPHYNLMERGAFEGPREALCLKEGLGVIPYFSLAAGFLTGKYRSAADLSKSPRGEGLAKYLNPRGERVLAALDAVSERRRATPAQVALAWLMARPAVTAPIASATSAAQLADLVAATRLALDADDIRRLDEASA